MKSVGVNVRRVYRAKNIQVSVKETFAEGGEATGYNVSLRNPEDAEQVKTFEEIRAAQFPDSTVVDTANFTLPVDASAPVRVKKVKEPKAPKEPKAKKEKAEKTGKAPKASNEPDSVPEATQQALDAHLADPQPFEGPIPGTLAEFKAKSVIALAVDNTTYQFVRLSSRTKWQIRNPESETLTAIPEVTFKTYKGMMSRGAEITFTSNL